MVSRRLSASTSRSSSASSSAPAALPPAPNRSNGQTTTRVLTATFLIGRTIDVFPRGDARPLPPRAAGEAVWEANPEMLFLLRPLPACPAGEGVWGAGTALIASQTASPAGQAGRGRGRRG